MITRRQQELILKMRKKTCDCNYEFTKNEIMEMGGYTDKHTFSKAIKNLEMHFMIEPYRIEIPDERFMRSSHVREMVKSTADPISDFTQKDIERLEKYVKNQDIEFEKLTPEDEEYLEKLTKIFDMLFPDNEIKIPTDEEIEENVRERCRNIVEMKKKYKRTPKGERLKYKLTEEGFLMGTILLKAEKWESVRKTGTF